MLLSGAEADPFAITADVEQYTLSDDRLNCQPAQSAPQDGFAEIQTHFVYGTPVDTFDLFFRRTYAADLIGTFCAYAVAITCERNNCVRVFERS